MSHIERVKEVRAIVEPHYNCGQSILVPFCKELGMTEEQAYALGAHLGKGMRLSGALLVLGAMGFSEEEAAAFIQQFQKRRGDTACGVLISGFSDPDSQDRKDFCNDLVLETAAALDQLTAQK